MLPDLKARAVIGLTGAPTPFDMTPGDIVTLDGQPWPAGSRAALKAAVAAFEAATGLPEAHVFSFRALRRAEPFAGRYFGALQEAGTDPEVIIAEYGRDQYEITSGPTDPPTAANRAVSIREITHEMARIEGWRATFAPKTHAEAAGNGVHMGRALGHVDGLVDLYHRPDRRPSRVPRPALGPGPAG